MIIDDTYGLPIMDIACCQPVCHFRPVGSLQAFLKFVCERLSGRRSEKLDDPHTIAYRQVFTTSA